MFVQAKLDELRSRRKAANLSQHRLSLIAGLGGNAINNIESGATRAIHPLRAKAIAEALHCEVSDIFINEIRS
jgi:DNA-binding XRE family transcriptional regulator